MKAYKKVPDYKKHNETTKRTMRVTRVVFSVSPYQLIVKYVFDLLLMDCCMKLVFLLPVTAATAGTAAAAESKSDGNNSTDSSDGINESMAVMASIKQLQ